MKVTVEEISAAVRVQRRHESGRHGRSKGGLRGGLRTAKDRGKAECIGMLGRRQVTPR